jgi:pyruvate dehydrogenase E1 component
VSDQDNVTGAGVLRQPPDADPQETGEWLDSLDAVVEREGPERAAYLLRRMLRRAGELRVGVPDLTSTAYVNTIPADAEPDYPGDEDVDRQLVNIARWNAAAIVSRANRPELGLGGHMASYASAAEL